MTLFTHHRSYGFPTVGSEELMLTDKVDTWPRSLACSGFKARSESSLAACVPPSRVFLVERRMTDNLGIQPRVKSLRSSYTGLYPHKPPNPNPCTQTYNRLIKAFGRERSLRGALGAAGKMRFVRLDCLIWP